jgi:lipopolysaccharide transport system ATP-binding protein
MRPIAIRVENLGKSYLIGNDKNASLTEKLSSLVSPKKSIVDIHQAISDLSFELHQGEALGILGRNGAGKSTLLKILSKITKPTNGKIELWGKVASLLEVGTGFHPELTGKENIFLSGSILGMKKAEIKERYDEIVAFSGIEKFLNTPVKRYSSGMYVRLAFAVAAHLESDILMIDEVLAVGDAEFQKKCLGKMNEVSAQFGRTVIFVSHNMQVVNQLCTKALFLETGKLKFIGKPSEAISLYLSNTLLENNFSNNMLHKVPMDPDFSFDSILMKQEGKVTSNFQNAFPIEIEITYTLKNKIVGLQLGIDLLDSNYTRISRSFFYEKNDEFTENAPPTLAIGTYTSRASIPENILLAGRYFINISASIFGKRMIEPNDGLEIIIEVIETGKYLRSIYNQNFQGMITLPIKWQTK